MEEERNRPSSCYLLMEDGAGLEGRCMTMPPLHTSAPGSAEAAQGQLPTRTAIFTSSTTSTAAGETKDKLSPLRDLSRNVPQKSQFATSAAVKAGILRQSPSIDSTGDESRAPQKRRIKKHVSIALPGSSRPVLSPRAKERRRGNSEDAALPENDELSRAEEVIVDVEVHDNTQTSVGKNIHCHNLQPCTSNSLSSQIAIYNI